MNQFECIRLMNEKTKQQETKPTDKLIDKAMEQVGYVYIPQTGEYLKVKTGNDNT